MSELTEVLDTWYRRVWGEEDASAIDEMFVQDPEVMCKDIWRFN